MTQELMGDIKSQYRIRMSVPQVIKLLVAGVDIEIIPRTESGTASFSDRTGAFDAQSVFNREPDSQSNSVTSLLPLTGGMRDEFDIKSSLYIYMIIMVTYQRRTSPVAYKEGVEFVSCPHIETHSL